ncbi:hypothetical protein CC78DRAFT_561908 [Lojkania enalia]|uniref:Protein FAF1 n=1 Tax=Lojkania enalia TaxID=147567 RepID=A0A9P4MXC0_9PLEO|nr:hypothetical protein CC78DRAFT_561908 [Didymosphaeria enalia]
MAPTLGKRKRVTREGLEQSSHLHSPSSASSNSDSEDVQDIFRRAFEAKFKPLDVEPQESKITEPEEEEEEEEEELEEDSDWSGISSEAEDEIEVIEHSTTRRLGDRLSKAEMRAFMSSKPPTSTIQTPSKPTFSKLAKDDDPTEASHLKNDLALQRLLRDSHLLSSLNSPSASGNSTPTLSLTGSSRHKSIDLHLQSLGAKSSIFTQKSMPMQDRKRILSKATQREERRRAEARENGIVLEKEKRVKKYVKERAKGVGGPGVGRFKGGTLTLSKRDIADITGGGRSGKGKGKGKGTYGKR